MRAKPALRFDPDGHIYTDEIGEMPHITGMLAEAGLVDDTWFTEEASERGTAVHRLTANYDMGVLDPETVVSKYRGWLLSHEKAMEAIRPTWSDIEVPFMHTQLRFGGRPDRVGEVFRLHTVADGKSGAENKKADPIQLALQAILAAPLTHLKDPRQWQRLNIYWSQTGRFKVVPRTDKRDFDTAYEIIRQCCRKK